jgi:hypothetical protein
VAVACLRARRLALHLVVVYRAASCLADQQSPSFRASCRRLAAGSASAKSARPAAIPWLLDALRQKLSSGCRAPWRPLGLPWSRIQIAAALFRACRTPSDMVTMPCCVSPAFFCGVDMGAETGPDAPGAPPISAGAAGPPLPISFISSGGGVLMAEPAPPGRSQRSPQRLARWCCADTESARWSD